MIEIVLPDPLQALQKIVPDCWSYSEAKAIQFTFKDDIYALANIAIALGNLNNVANILRFIATEPSWYSSSLYQAQVSK